MKRTVMLAVFVFAIGGASIWAVAGGKIAACVGGHGHAADKNIAVADAAGGGSKDASACDPASCESGGTSAAVAKSSGKVLGKFDLAMAGCRFACATNMKYDAKSVIAQPGAKDGRLTQCPVSGVVFSVDENRPHIRVGVDDYVTCCDTCAEELRKNPRRFVRV